MLIKIRHKDPTSNSREYVDKTYKIPDEFEWLEKVLQDHFIDIVEYPMFQSTGIYLHQKTNSEDIDSFTIRDSNVPSNRKDGFLNALNSFKSLFIS